MGSHTDYNDGFVLTMAIGQNTWVAAHPRQDLRVRVRSINAGDTREFSIDDVPLKGDWSSYVHGVLWKLLLAGYEFPGFDAVIHGDIPLGSGLSSSASLAVVTAILAIELGGQLPTDRLALAKLCQQSENEIVGVPCGILDQYSSLFGKARHAMLLDCRALTCQHTALPKDLQVIVCDTRAPRELANSAYAQRRAECESGVRLLSAAMPIGALRDVSSAQFERCQSRLPETVRQRCQYVIQENQRVCDMACALATNDFAAIRMICDASFEDADRLYEIVTAEMRAMRDASCAAPGLVGVRNSGGGFGGCLVAFVTASKTDAFIKSVHNAYQSTTGIEPSIFAVKASDGAGILESCSGDRPRSPGGDE